MFGINQKRLVRSTAKLAARCCSYLSTNRGCDCKYISDDTGENTIMSGSESGSGCPELTMLAELVAAMSDQEFNAITKRAGILITDESEPIDATNILEEEKQKHADYMKQSAFFFKPTLKPNTTSLPKKYRKSAYDLGNAKTSIQKALKSK